jgi:hypothetical protein
MRMHDTAMLMPAVLHMAGLLEIDPTDLLVAVCARWATVTNPGNVLTTALEAARWFPITLRGPLAPFGPTFQTVGSAAYHLAVRAELLAAPTVPPEFRGDGTVLLPQLDFGRRLNRTPQAIGHCIAAAVTYELLSVADDFCSYTLGIAKTYRFNFDCPHYAPPDIQAQLAARRAAAGIQDTPDMGEEET